jgi:hypothetical protein
MELIVARTNVRQFYAYRLDWMYAHGGPLIGTAQILGNLFMRFYVPSTYYFNNIKPCGTSPLGDHFLGTEGLEIHHHGAGIQRFDKLDILTNWPVAQTHLRVCTDDNYLGPFLNCGKCHKCLHTIVYLETKRNSGKFEAVFENGYSFIRLFHWLFIVFMSNEGIRRLIKSAMQARRFEIVTMMLGMFISVRVRKLFYRFTSSLSYKNKMRLLGFRRKLLRKKKQPSSY